MIKIYKHILIFLLHSTPSYVLSCHLCRKSTSLTTVLQTTNTDTTTIRAVPVHSLHPHQLPQRPFSPDQQHTALRSPLAQTPLW